ncbi:MAG: arginine--tRNA ligase [Candidatus Eisenbacteria bacterium]|nr:arginine--tRNA ligase [Candidatus Eisenbacteria bacterium]
MFQEDLTRGLERALRKLGLDAERIDVTPPRDPSHGDAATNVALALAKSEGRNPRDLAREIVGALELPPEFVESVEIAGPGFINFRFTPSWYDSALREVVRAGDAYGRTKAASGQKIQIEFVSANPTGPVNIVSARAAAVGNAMANLLEWAGAEVEREFYVNDAGQQVEKLALSVEARFRELEGHPLEIPEGGYHGEYVIDVTKAVLEENPELRDAPSEVRVERFKVAAIEHLVQSQREDLSAFGVEFDRWFHETELAEAGEVEAVLERLIASGETYEHEGAVWLRTQPHGTNDDKVIVKSDGVPTYLLPDLAYHVNKFNRGYDPVIDLWGPDHHAHVAETHAGLEILGFPKERLEIQIVQQVNLLEGGEQVKMSKRAGKIVTLKELVDDVGSDVAKFFFLMRRQSAHLDFDLDLARQQTDENPVFYVQYAHARVASLVRFAEERGQSVPDPDEVDLSDVRTGDAAQLILLLAEFPEFIASAAIAREPHRLTGFLRDVSARFHSYYHDNRIVTDDEEQSAARLFLSQATRVVLANGLTVLGVGAPDRM